MQVRDPVRAAGVSAHITCMASLGTDLADVGFAPVNDVPEQVPAEPVNDGRTLIVGPTFAKTLYSVWSGAPTTIVDFSRRSRN